MARVKIYCPECSEVCVVQVEDYELGDDCQAEGFEAECNCGCSFSFDLYLAILNKKPK